MSSPRSDKGNIDIDMLNMVKKLKSKYIFPYSEGHIKDRSSRFKAEYRAEVEKDLEFVKTITDDYLLISRSQIPDVNIRQKEIIIVKKPMLEYFDAYIKMPKTESAKADRMEFEDFTVDMSAVATDHPLYEYLKENGGRVTPSGLNDFVNGLLDYIFDDINVYKRLRSYIKTLDVEKILNQPMECMARLQADRLLYYMAPMIEYKDDDEKALAGKWKGICERWFSMNGKPCFEELIKQGYTLLDLHPLFNDKMKKGKNTLDNIVRDGSHCYYASNAKYFVSEDDRTRKKADFMYRAFGVNTKVMSESEFLNCVSTV